MPQRLERSLNETNAPFFTCTGDGAPLLLRTTGAAGIVFAAVAFTGVFFEGERELLFFLVAMACFLLTFLRWWLWETRRRQRFTPFLPDAIEGLHAARFL